MLRKLNLRLWLSFFLKIILVCLLFGQQAHSSFFCKDLLKSEETGSQIDIFESFERIEVEVQELMSEINSQFGQNPKRDIELTTLILKINEQSLVLEALQSRALEDQPISRVEIENLQANLLSLDRSSRESKGKVDDVKPQEKGLPDNSLDYILKNPLLTVAERIYKVDSAQNREIHFLFSEKLVLELFSDTNLHGALKKSLKKIALGIFGTKREGSGVIKFDNYKGLVELRLVGGSAGRLRIYGYLENGVIHFVQWSKSNEHGASRISIMAKSVYKIWSERNPERRK